MPQNERTAVEPAAAGFASVVCRSHDDVFAGRGVPTSETVGGEASPVPLERSGASPELQEDTAGDGLSEGASGSIVVDQHFSVVSRWPCFALRRHHVYSLTGA